MAGSAHVPDGGRPAGCAARPAHPRGVRRAGGGRGGARVRARGAPPGAHRRAAALGGRGGAGRRRRDDADGHLAAAPGPARQRGARGAVALRQPVDPRRPGRGLLGVHVAKRLVGYRVRTGDLFAPAVAARHGGRPGRVPADRDARHAHGHCVRASRWTPRRGRSGLGRRPVSPLHPSFAYEIAFQLAAFVALWVWLRHLALGPGDDVRPLRRGVRGVPVPRRVRARQRGRLARPHPPAAVPRRRGARRAGAGRRAAAARRGCPTSAGAPAPPTRRRSPHERDAAAR